MAKRESQGMQIAVILLVMFSLLMTVTTVLFWNQSKTRNEELEKLRAEKATSDQNTSTVLLENQDFRQWLGYSPSEEMGKVRTEVEAALSLYGPNYPPEKRNLRDLPQFLTGVVQDQAQRLNEAAVREARLKEERDQAREQERRNVKVAEDNHEQARKDLESEKEKFAGEVQRLKNDLSAQQARHQKAQLASNKDIDELKSRVAQLESEANMLEGQNEVLSGQVEGFRSESFDRPDGQITWVNQSLRMVYIDLGSADAIRPQYTFSVYDVDVNNLARAEKKGSIEVKRVLGDHLSEARILEDKVSKPIIAGDIIYSPIYQRGNPVRFALAGFMDVNGDGRSDREFVRNLIRLQGGEIDAEVDDEGQRTGKVTIETRYLIRGADPPGQLRSAYADAMAKIQREADTASATTISLSRFLADSGYRGSMRTVGLGAALNSEDFRADRVGDERFRPRVAEPVPTP